MAIDIIDGFEIIEVDQREHAAFVVAPGVGQGAPELAVEAAPVHQSGEFIISI